MLCCLFSGATGRRGVTVWATACALALLASETHALPHAAEHGDAQNEIDLDAALSLALSSGPDVLIAQRQADIRRGDLAGAEVFPRNPTLSTSGGARYGFGEGIGADANVGMSQALPLFGRWGAAEEAAKAGVSSAETNVWAEQVRLAQRVALSYVAAQRVKAQLDVADKRVALVQDIVDKAQRRLAAGDGTVLDVNVWEAELGQAEAMRARLEASYISARVALAVLCGLDPSLAPKPASELDATTFVSWTSDVSERADLVALRERVAAAEKTITREQKEAWPDITLNARAGTEGARWQNGPAGELVGGAGVSIPLPLLERNQGGVLSAKARADVRRAELRRATLRANADVVIARAELDAYEHAAETLKTRVKGKQRTNLDLLKKAYVAGKLGVADLLLRQRFVLDAEAAYVDAVADVLAARIRLAFASGALSSRVTTMLALVSDGGPR